MTDPCAETQKGIPTGDTQASAAAESGAPLVCPYAYKNFCALACRQGPEVGAHRRQRLLRAPGRRGGRISPLKAAAPLLHRGPLPLAANENSDDVICADVGTTGTRAGDVVVRWSPDGHSDNPGVRCPVSVV